LNVLAGERYKTIAKETAALLRGEYGAAPASYNQELQERVLEGAEPMTCRPADRLENELESLTQELKGNAAELSFKLADEEVEDVLIFALFAQIGLKFLQNRGNPEAFEPTPTESPESDETRSEGVYTVTVKGNSYTVHVAEGGEISSIVPAGKPASPKESAPVPVPTPPIAAVVGGEPLHAPLTGAVISVIVKPGQVVQDDTVVIIMEAMKMETEVCAHRSGTVAHVYVKEGDNVNVGDPLLTIA
jgi:oxaloacetate decarboxylase alpha subunit